MVETEVSGRQGGVGGVGEVLKEQEVSYWLPGKKKPLTRSNVIEQRFPGVLVLFLLQAFVEVCMKSKNKSEAKKYVSKVTLEQKVKAHLAVR